MSTLGFKLQEITANKLSMIKQLNAEIALAIKNGWKNHEADCLKELAKTKYEAMNPHTVFISS
jgi:hypothetical protein